MAPVSTTAAAGPHPKEQAMDAPLSPVSGAGMNRRDRRRDRRRI
jgi:hypothetical protein